MRFIYCLHEKPRLTAKSGIFEGHIQATLYEGGFLLIPFKERFA